jgi:stage III sporulation protein AF
MTIPSSPTALDGLAAATIGAIAASGGLAAGVRFWVREILIVLFMAGVLEMLLPDNGSKRFARVAIGFFVVLAVSRPLVDFVGAGADLGAELAGLAAWQSTAILTGPRAPDKDPLDQGASLREASRERALAAARAALETQIVALVERDASVAEASADVSLVSDPSSARYGALESVTVRVWLARPRDGGGPGGSETSGRTTDPPIEPVRVRVDPIITGWSRSGTEGGSGQGATGQPVSGSGPTIVASGTGPDLPVAGSAGELAGRLRSQLILLFGVPPGGLRVEVWP